MAEAGRGARTSARSERRATTVERTWPADAATTADLTRPRDDIVQERRDGDGAFSQAAGPFTSYRRTVVVEAGEVREQTRYRLSLPWFGWLFTLPVRWAVARRGRPPGRQTARRPPGRQTARRPPGRQTARRRPGTSTTGAAGTPWWSPPDRLSPHALTVLGLLAAASMSAAFINTLFTQTVNFAADDFGVGDTGVGIAGALVRAGIIITLPVAALSDRVGRRRVIVTMAFAAPLFSAAGAFAPSFPFLVTTQAIGRPLGLALDFMIAVVAAEEMPRNCRAYAVSVLALASGLGAGLAVASLPLADLSHAGWRYVYLVALIWLVVAVDVARRLPETARFERPHVTAPRLDRGRFAVLAAIALLSNLFIAPASLFQNGYLKDERGFSASVIAFFTLATATPAAVGLIVGGRLADMNGRRKVIAIGLPLGATLLVVSYSVAGPAMWLSVLFAGIIGGLAYPALAVYRTELFPTGNRGRASGYLTAAALVGGIGGLLAMGQALDAGVSHGAIMGLLALGQLAAVGVALRWLPETAHRELEDLNPIDADRIPTTGPLPPR